MEDLMLMHARGAIVTFVPVGLLSLLPLHAAGDAGSPDDPFRQWRHAGHFSAIRYAPNARILRWRRDTLDALAASPLSLLAADVPNGHGIGRPLLYAGAETDAIVRLWEEPTPVRRHKCSWEEFREAAEHHAVWHLACHARAVPNAILNTTLYFADTQVTMERLRAELGPDRRRLAVLSACQTHLTGTASPNEAIGLPSALLQLGFAGVIAAAWKANDLATTFLMTRYYQLWRYGELHPAVALNAAQQWLRRATRPDLADLLPKLAPIIEMVEVTEGDRPFAHPRYWAAFAYTGV